MDEVAEVELPTQENIHTDLKSVFKGAIRVALEVILEEELREMVGAGRWEPFGQRVDRRNGTYLRRLITSMGAVDLEVPRAREGGSAGAAVFGRYKRHTQEIDDTIVSAYVHGASTRDIGQITETLMGEHGLGTGTASGPPTGSSGCTARSSAAPAPSAPSRTAPARSASSPPSPSRSPPSGPTAVTST